MKTLRVVAVEEKVSPEVAAKMGHQGRYKVLTFRTNPLVKARNEIGEEHIMKVPVRQTAIVSWIDSPIPGRNISDFGADLDVGDLVPGDIVQREVEPYFIPSSTGDTEYEGKKGRWVSTASTIVFGNSDNPQDWHMDVLRAFRQRNFILKGAGDAGAPGGNLESALRRERTKVEGHDPNANLPLALQGADPETVRNYSDNSSVRQQDEGQNAR